MSSPVVDDGRRRRLLGRKKLLATESKRMKARSLRLEDSVYQLLNVLKSSGHFVTMNDFVSYLLRNEQESRRRAQKVSMWAAVESQEATAQAANPLSFTPVRRSGGAPHCSTPSSLRVDPTQPLVFDLSPVRPPEATGKESHNSESFSVDVTGLEDSSEDEDFDPVALLADEIDEHSDGAEDVDSASDDELLMSIVEDELQR